MLCIRQLRWLLLSLALIGLDQYTKWQMITHFSPYQMKPILSMLNLVLVYNTGAAFSFLAQTGAWHHWFFIGFSALMSIVLWRWLCHTPTTDRWQSAGIALILGGAVGNLIDRLHLGHVIDFIDVYYRTLHWPAFNIADAGICLGAVCLVIDLMRR